jgi:hypothetical protein
VAKAIPLAFIRKLGTTQKKFLERLDRLSKLEHAHIAKVHGYRKTKAAVYVRATSP